MRWWWLAPLILLGALGCDSSPVKLTKIHGTVTFTDGTVPKGEVGRVRFEPVADGGQKIIKGAAGTLDARGHYELMTLRPGDGVIPGKYKVCFTIHKTYLGQESLIPARYNEPATTPFEVTIEPGSTKPFDFQLETK